MELLAAIVEATAVEMIRKYVSMPSMPPDIAPAEYADQLPIDLDLSDTINFLGYFLNGCG